VSSYFKKIKTISPWAVARNYEAIITINIERTDGKRLKPDVLVNKTLKVERLGKNRMIILGWILFQIV
jgi:hypothetical protein